MWIVSNKLSIMKQHADGRIVPCNYASIKSGDFVDVTAVVDIIAPPGVASKVTINFAMQQVTKLKAGAPVVEVRAIIHKMQNSRSPLT